MLGTIASLEMSRITQESMCKHGVIVYMQCEYL